MYTKRMFQWKMDRYSYYNMIQVIKHEAMNKDTLKNTCGIFVTGPCV